MHVIRGDKGTDPRDTLVFRDQPEEEVLANETEEEQLGRKEKNQKKVLLLKLNDNQEIAPSGFTVPQAYALQKKN